MSKYHINDEGNPAICSADPNNPKAKGCPYRADAHGEFASIEEARAFAEEYVAKTEERNKFESLSRSSGDRMRKESKERKLDEFADLTPEEIADALQNPGTPIRFNEDGSLQTPPTGTLQDPFDLAELTPEQARSYLLSKGYSEERLAKLEADFKGVPPEPDLSGRALITAATVDLMVGPPQGHVRFSQDTSDNYSFSMSNFAEVGQTVGMIETDPKTGFLVPAKDPKAALSWMQVSNPANNVFQLQRHMGINRLFMPQTANSGVTGEARKKLDGLAEYIENNRHKSADAILADPEFRRLNSELQMKATDVRKLHAAEYGVKNGENLNREDFLNEMEVNGANWMARDMREKYGFRSTNETYGSAELSSMKPTQSGISVLQVQGMAQGTINSFVQRVKEEQDKGVAVTPEVSQQLFDSVMGKRTIVTEDGYIIDGHHGLAKAALINAMIRDGSLSRQLRTAGLDAPAPREARLGVMKLGMDGGQAFDAVTHWTEQNGFPVSGMR